MSISIVKGKNVDVHLWTPVHEVESQALDQLKNIAALPWVFHHVSVMPDVHYGKGATVGSVVAMKDAVSPAAVGVDIGCGMAAVKTSLKASDLPDNLEAIRHAIERSIPVGFNSHQHVSAGVAHNPMWSAWDTLQAGHCDKGKAMKQVGSLGGGNHFIELCLDTEQNVWLMLHSGSRNVGKEIAEGHINIAKKLAHNGHLPDPDLAVFLAGTPEMQAYRRDLFWAQDYAWQNRLEMLRLCKVDLVRAFPEISFAEPIVCHHNFVSEETHFEQEVLVTRKGAIQANKGQMGIIPGSMGTKSYIVRGLGNPESFCSASHGAGRRMSRGAAKRSFTLDDLAKQTEGVCCRKDAGVLDEIPGAYKSIDQVIANQADLVEVVAELKGILCIKG
jgi:tRNA-splicing ligase RtcB